MEIGVNFFDSAEAYGWGGSEIALGKAVKGRRDQAVIATKAAPILGPEPDREVLFSRDVLVRKVEGSLKRLGTDYIDLYLLHQPDEKTPSRAHDVPPRDTPTRQHMEEIADAMDALVHSGKIRYWGVSNHLPRQIDELIELGKRAGTSPIAGLEDYFNIVAADRRDFMANELFPLIRKGNLGLMAFSPLGEGRLVTEREPEEGSRLLDVIATLDEVAKELDVSRPQVCVSWVASHPRSHERVVRCRKTGTCRGKLQGYRVGASSRSHAEAQCCSRYLHGPSNRAGMSATRLRRNQGLPCNPSRTISQVSSTFSPTPHTRASATTMKFTGPAHSQ